MVTAATRERRKRLARLLQRDPDISNRAAGLELGAHHSTIAKDRLALAKRDRPLPAPPLANRRALKSGAYSERELAKPRQEWANTLRKLYPWLDDIRLATLSDRLSRLGKAHGWLDEQADIVRDDDGVPWPLVRDVEKWATRTEQMVAELEAEARERGREPHAFDAVVAEIAAEDNQDDEGTET